MPRNAKDGQPPPGAEGDRGRWLSSHLELDFCPPEPERRNFCCFKPSCVVPATVAPGHWHSPGQLKCLRLHRQWRPQHDCLGSCPRLHLPVSASPPHSPSGHSPGHAGPLLTLLHPLGSDGGSSAGIRPPPPGPALTCLHLATCTPSRQLRGHRERNSSRGVLNQPRRLHRWWALGSEGGHGSLSGWGYGQSHLRGQQMGRAVSAPRGPGSSRRGGPGRPPALEHGAGPGPPSLGTVPRMDFVPQGTGRLRGDAPFPSWLGVAWHGGHYGWGTSRAGTGCRGGKGPCAELSWRAGGSGTWRVGAESSSPSPHPRGNRRSRELDSQPHPHCPPAWDHMNPKRGRKERDQDPVTPQPLCALGPLPSLSHLSRRKSPETVML